MRRTCLTLTATVACAVAGLATGGRAAGALSCAPHPNGSPHGIASGTEVLAGPGRFFERFDFAVVGTVTRIETVETPGPDHGVTTVAVDVTAVLGRDKATAIIELTTPDPGWLAGYPFGEGTDYFVPVQTEGPEGQPNYTFACDPIAEAPAAAPLAAELGTLAAEAGIAFSTTATAGPSEVRVDDRTTGDDDRGGDDGEGDARIFGSAAPSGPSGRTAATVAGLTGATIAAGALHHRRRARRRRRATDPV